MNPADEEAVKLVPTQGRSPGAAAGSHDDLAERLHATPKDPRGTNHQSKPAEHFASDSQLEEQLRVSVEALLHSDPPPKPVEEVDDLLLAISHHLDDEASERKKIHNRLRAIENEMERLASRGFRYLVAICIGVAVILAWQSFGEAAKQIIATRAPELGWSPEAKQRIASWVQQLGWTKPPVVESKVAPVAQTATEMVAPKAPAAPSLNPQQVQQIKTDIAAGRQAIERHLADVRATVEQLAASQDQMAREIEKLRAANQEILAKIPTPPPKRPAPARKPIQTAPSRSQIPIPPRPLSHP